MKRKIFVTVCILCALLAGCAKCINTEYKEINVVITDTYHKPHTIIPVRVGKVTTFTNSPEIHKVYVSSEFGEFSVSGRDTYHLFRDKVGQEAVGTLEIKTYDNGKAKYRITEIREE